MWRAEPLLIIGSALLLILPLQFADQSRRELDLPFENRIVAPLEVAWSDRGLPRDVIVRSTAATTSSQRPAAPPERVEPAAAASIATNPPPVTAAELDAAALALRKALVNIYCLAPAGSGLRSASASGVIISSRGYILTNAHVAYNFLLANKGVSCVIRTGDPAKATYKAAIVHIPEQWIRDNASILAEESPSGTGERDFALLVVTASATSAPLPLRFDYVPIVESVPPVGSPVVIGSYGAQFLQFNQIHYALSPTIVFGMVKNLLTFTARTADVISLGGSAAAQEGSSGGGVVNGEGELVGDITTSTTVGETASRVLSAITTAYIRREYLRETGGTLDALLATPPAEAIAAFAPQIPDLEAELLRALHN